MSKKDPVEVADDLMKNGEEEEEKKEPQPPKWVRYDELRPLVSELVQMFPEEIGHIKPASIGYAAFSKKKSKALAKIYPMKPMYGLFSSIDYILSIHLENWAIASVSKRYVLVLHELLHIPLEGHIENSSDYRKTLDHDVQDFSMLIKMFGVNWEESEKILRKLRKPENGSTKSDDGVGAGVTTVKDN